MEFKFDSEETGILKSPPTFSGKGRLLLRIHDDDLWSNEKDGKTVGVDEYWDGLLHHLAKYWHHLQAEQIYPLGNNPPSPADFLDKALADLDWTFRPPEELYPLERKIIAFSDRHNLAAGMPEIHLPPVFFMREGNDMRVVAELCDIRIPHQQAMAQLEAMGNAIAAVVSPQSSRGQGILNKWENRHKPLSDVTVLALTMGMTEGRVTALAANDDIHAMFGQPSLTAPSPMQIATRMTQHALLDDELREILMRISNLQMTRTDGKYERLREQAVRFLDDIRSERAFSQGYALAQWLRQKLKINDLEMVDPEFLLGQWNVTIQNTRVSELIDALALWDGDSAGIMVNSRGLKAQHAWGRRSSLAHEIAHLLVDTNHALPSVEILGGRMPPLVEKRANAFAAEFLLPRSQVIAFAPAEISPQTLRELVENLSEKFAVGHILTAHQVENALQDQLDHQCRMFLDRYTKRY